MMEKEAAVDLSFVEFPADGGDAKSKFAMMVSGGETLPDVLLSFGFSSGEIQEYGSKDVFVRLNDYFDDAEKMPHFSAIESKEDKETMLLSTQTEAGDNYYMPQYYPEALNHVGFGLFINHTWLEQLNIPMPKTTDEYYDAVEKMVNSDPNGNGQRDEIGVTGSKDNWARFPFNYFMNAFIFYNEQNYGLTLADDGKTVMAPFTTQEWKQGLEFMHKLYDNGLWPMESFTQDLTQLCATLNNEVQLVASASGKPGDYQDAKTNQNFLDMRFMEPLTGPDGVCYATYQVQGPSQGMFITKDCQNLDAAIRLGDLCYRFDISVSIQGGEEGVDWSAAPDVLDQYKAYATEGTDFRWVYLNFSKVWGAATDKTWYLSGPRYLSGAWTYVNSESVVENVEPGSYDDIFQEYLDLRATSYAPKHPESLLPASLIYTEEEAVRLGDIASVVSSYVSENNTAFILGNRSFSDWDAYISELDEMKLPELVSIAQSAYDRMKGN